MSLPLFVEVPSLGSLPDETASHFFERWGTRMNAEEVNRKLLEFVKSEAKPETVRMREISAKSYDDPRLAYYSDK